MADSPAERLRSRMQATAAKSRPAAVQVERERVVRLSVDLPESAYRDVKAATLAYSERLGRAVRTVHVIRALLDELHADDRLRQRVEARLRGQG